MSRSHAGSLLAIKGARCGIGNTCIYMPRAPCICILQVNKVKTSSFRCLAVLNRLKHPFLPQAAADWLPHDYIPALIP